MAVFCPQGKDQKITTIHQLLPLGEHIMSAELKQKIQDLKGRLISLKEHL